ncbi:MAG: YsnF/AvaK domain-containing protein [bacterium]
MAATIVGLFETRDRAEACHDDLIKAGFHEDEIHLSEESAQARQPEQAEPGFWDRVKDWLGMEETSYYQQETSRRGGTLVTVNTSDENADAAADVIERNEPLDIGTEAGQAEERREEAPREPQRESEEERIPLPEEELRVGKRRVTRGGVRIYTHVTERPVEEQVELTDEHVDVERRNVDQPADEDAFKERTIETSETHEEPVVDKEARTKEELVLRKEQEEHTETVRDTVRETEAEVEGGEQGRAGQEDVDDSAYRFGEELARDERFRDRAFDNIEPEARYAFEHRNLGDWSRHREAVRRGYEHSRRAA